VFGNFSIFVYRTDVMEGTGEIADELIFKSLIGKRDKLVSELRRIENDLKRLNIAIEIFQPTINKGSGNDPGVDISSQENSEDYSEKFSALQQLHFALKHLGSATAPEITDYIYEVDKRWERNKLHKRLTDIASIEYGKGRLFGYKSNGRYIYSLKKQE
jgi:hypothetical protein